MASASFRVKEFGFGERLQYPICITWDGEKVEDRPTAVQTLTGQGHYIIPEAEGGGLQTLSSSSEPSCCYLIPPGAETDTIRKFTFLRSSSFTVKASYADLPPGSPQAQLGKVYVHQNSQSISLSLCDLCLLFSSSRVKGSASRRHRFLCISTPFSLRMSSYRTDFLLSLGGHTGRKET